MTSSSAALTMLAALVCLGVVLSTAPLVPATRASSPNIIIILLDDAGYGDFDSHKVPTPHLNSISANGVEFRNAYVTAPQCSPSRVGLLTGRYQQHFGHETNTEFLASLSQRSTRIIPQFLPPHYHSGLFGKWNLGDIPNPPQSHGFHEALLYRHLEESFAANASLLLGDRPVRGRAYSTSLIFQSANEFISNVSASEDRSPFFLYLAPMSPHVPHVFPPSYGNRFNNLDPSLPIARRKVLTMMTEIDDGVGALLGLLERRKLSNGTLLFLVNDNGAPPVLRSSINPNSPLRGFKGELYEGGIHVKYALQWPSVLSPGQVIDEPVSTLDILPTLLQLWRPQSLGVEKEQGLDGRSLLPLLRFDRGKDHHLHAPLESSQRHRSLFWRFLMSCKSEKRAMRTGALKWVRIGSDPVAAELYNISSDQQETVDLASLLPEVVQEMGREFSDWESQFPAISGRSGAPACLPP
jgi:arylsulfatase A-like enzyme